VTLAFELEKALRVADQGQIDLPREAGVAVANKNVEDGRSLCGKEI
jgi:hypothetical protein